jgi:predicted dehydrogenase
MLKIGILSTAHMHAAAYVAGLRGSTEAQIVGLWDDDTARKDERAAGFSIRAYETLDGLLDASDAVVICSENSKHRALTKAAAAAGKHVISEKPLAPNADDAKAMVDACAKNNVKLYTAFPCRFSPAFWQLKSAVESGDLGEILAARCTNQGMCPGGWFIDTKLSGGGAVMDHTVHVTDLLRALLGDEAKEVYCEASNGFAHSDYDDAGISTITFESGIYASLDASWSRPKSFPTWGNVTMSVIGTKGVIEMDMFAQESVLYSDKTNKVSYQNWGSNIDAGLVTAFVKACLGDEASHKMLASGVDGLRAVEVVEAAYKSVASNQPERVVRR